MRFINKILGFALIIIIAISGIVVSADATLIVDKPQVDADRNIITLTGRVSGAGSGVLLTIKVINPSMSETNANTADNPTLNGIYNHIGEVLTVAGGEFSYKFYISETSPSSTDTEKYIVRVKGLGAVVEKTFDYANSVDKNIAFQSVLSSSKIDMLATLTANSSRLGLTMELYDDDIFKNVVARTFVANAIFNGKPYSTITDLYIAFKSAVVLGAIVYNASADNLKQVILAYNDLIGLDLSSSTFLTFSNDYKDNVYYSLFTKRSECIDFVTSRSIFDELVLLMGVNTAPNKDAVKNVLVEFQALISQNDTAMSLVMQNYLNANYERISYVNGEILKVQPSSLTDLKNTITISMNFDLSVGNTAGKSSNGGGKSTNTIINVVKQVEQPIVDEPIEWIDIGNVPWAEESIVELAGKGIIQGFGNGEFRPFNNITRAEFVKMVMLALKVTDNSAVSDFSDVGTKHWAYKQISTAQKLGIINGTGEGSFGVDEKISRQDIAVIIYRTLKYLEKNLEPKTDAIIFSDSDLIDDYARDAVVNMQQAGIITGYSDDRVGAKDFATRAQVAKIIYMLLEVM